MNHVRVRLVDLGTFRQLPVRLQTSRLIGRVFQDDVALLVLVIPQGQKYDVPLIDPDLFAQLPANVRESLLAVKTEGLEATVAEHFDYLGILCKSQ